MACFYWALPVKRFGLFRFVSLYIGPFGFLVLYIDKCRFVVVKSSRSFTTINRHLLFCSSKSLKAFFGLMFSV